MPRYVDREARRREVVDALFRIVVRDGLQRASLRTVAEESGLNIGSVRHYFADQEELMVFAMRSMLDRVAGRLLDRIREAGDLEAYPAGERLRLAETLLAELLPLDELRRAEFTVFLEFGTAARTNPAFAGLAREAAENERALIRRVLTRLAEAGALRPGLDLGIETERLTSLLDGLSLTALLRPDVLSARTTTAVLHAHLAELREPPGE